MQTKDIIKKWYYALEFPSRFDKEFLVALENYEIDTSITIDNYPTDCEEGTKNLLYYLYFCEAVKKKYEENNISEDILIDTLRDIVRWCITWSDIKGCLFLGELFWLKRHLTFKLFKIGRLQYCFGKAEHDAENFGLKKEENILEVHIPATGPMREEDCKESVKLAKEFFLSHFPDYSYRFFTCHSWLLDRTLEQFLDDDSNIIKFQKMFNIIKDDNSNEIFRYLFSWDTNMENLYQRVPTSSLAKKVLEASKTTQFHESYGIFE
ncbi:MAG: DUF5596 domain-containing protein [Clostridia bacterium]|nr:DUF5596 domain-containing protein [Clostridia bacterium]